MNIPKTYRDAITCPDKEHWLRAMNEELAIFVKHNTFEEWATDGYLPENALRSDWVLQVLHRKKEKITKLHESIFVSLEDY